MPRFPGSLAVAAAVATLASAACSGTSSSDAVSPITGITVRAETVTQGKGCGRGATQVFKYAVLVGKASQPDPSKPAVFTDQLSSNVYDCFTDGTFVELPADDEGFGRYAVLVYAYNEAAYLEAGGDQAVVEEARNYNTVEKNTKPTWSTRCDAEQRALVQSLVRCNPLVASNAASSVTLELGTIPSASGPLTCDKDYAKVVYRFATNDGAPGPASETPCSRAGAGTPPVTIQISPAVAPATYAFEIAPIRADGTAIGQTTCTAATSPGLEAKATCAPL